MSGATTIRTRRVSELFMIGPSGVLGKSLAPTKGSQQSPQRDPQPEGAWLATIVRMAGLAVP